MAHPSREEMEALRTEFQLHPVMVQDTLDPIHLPKFERLGSLTFAILRIYDVDADPRADSIRSLTRKVSIFIGPDFIITVHRLDPEFFQGLFDKCMDEISQKKEESQVSQQQILVKFLNRALKSYHIPLERGEDELDLFEAAMFDQGNDPKMFQDLHIIRRRLSLIKRILLHSHDVIQRLSPSSDNNAPLFQDLRENLSTMVFMTDELLEDATSLLNLQISLASQKTNEVMRILTVFSVFFMPLNFIAGLYGMNFENMPELGHPFGYPGVLLLMTITTLLIAFWFYRRGWLGSRT